MVHTLWMKPVPTVVPPVWRPAHLQRGLVQLPYMPLVGGHRGDTWRHLGWFTRRHRKGAAALRGLDGDGSDWSGEYDTKLTFLGPRWPGPMTMEPTSDSVEWPPPYLQTLRWKPVLHNVRISTKPGTRHNHKPANMRLVKHVKNAKRKHAIKQSAKSTAKPVVKSIAKRKNHRRKLAAKPVSKLVAKPVTKPVPKPALKPAVRTVATLEEEPGAKFADSTSDSPTEKSLVKQVEWVLDVPMEKPVGQPVTESSLPAPGQEAAPPVWGPEKNRPDGQASHNGVQTYGSQPPKNSQNPQVSSSAVISTFKFAGPPSYGVERLKSTSGAHPTGAAEVTYASSTTALSSASETTKNTRNPSEVTTNSPRPKKDLSDEEVMKALNLNTSGLVLEMAVFCDADCKKSFVETFGSADNLLEALKAIVAQAQVFYKPPWLKQQMHIVITRLDLLETPPNPLMESSDADKLLKGFSNFTALENPPDGQPGHWDVALLLTGKDMHAPKDDKNDTSVLGKAYLGGACSQGFANVVVEFGSTNPRRRPMTTFGLQTSNVAAHELAHNLGVQHDGPPTNRDCSLDQYLMGPWRTSNTTTWWSPCSLQVLTKLAQNEKLACLKQPPMASLRQAVEWNSWRSSPPPGQQWDADAQCAVFLKSDAAKCSAKEENMNAICRALQCKSPERIGLFAAGHALEGTYCGESSWCQGSKCVPFPKTTPVEPGDWSDWTTVSECSQPCLEDSMPLKRMKRTCNKPRRRNTLEGCEGDSLMLTPCDITAEKKASQCTHFKSNKEYIDEKCAAFARFKPELKPTGTKVPYSAAQPWRACAIHCGYRGDAYIAAKFFLNEQTNETGVLPDGTRCHFEKAKGAAYYCQQGQCVTLLQSLAGIQDSREAQVLELEDSDWAPDTEGRRMVEKYMEYVPGKDFPTLDVSKVPKAQGRISIDDL
ncbi:uncharacterized protein LOC144110622 [Amblyomma americanum]